MPRGAWEKLYGEGNQVKIYMNRKHGNDKIHGDARAFAINT